MTYYLVYKLTNLVNGKIYIGCHMTKDIDDGYMGSGKRLYYAKKKHGVENFKKEILSSHETPEEMLAEEARIVNEEFLGRNDVYNLMCGGRGSWLILNQKLTAEQRTKAGNAGGFANFTFEQRSKLAKLYDTGKYLAAWRSRTPNFYKNSLQLATEKAKSSESILKRKETFSKIGHQQGEKNSSFGTIWITNEIRNRKIKKTDLIPEGWKKGRTIARLR